jgi:outer membrane protein assembly factor BamB
MKKLVCLLTANFLAPLGAADWPSYQRDAARSGVTPEKLQLPLAEIWVHRARHGPRPAWDGPAKWDGWHKIYNLKDRVAFDRALQVVAAADAVYFGSSADDKVYCLDAATGGTRWVFYTEGPVRLAPAVAGGKVYVGSDDGHVYCLDAGDGRLIWKHRPGPRDRRVPGNERIASLWAIRTGVVVADGRVYCSAGVVPAATVYLCAMDATSGRELWKTAMNDLPAQGYLLASATRLYVPTGRDRPLVFDRASGERLYQIKGGGGGTYALLAGDMLHYGPGQTGEVSAHAAGQKDQLASFSGTHLVVTAGTSYLQTDTQLSALDRPAYIKRYAERRRLEGRRGKINERLKKMGAKAASEEGKKLRAEAAALAGEIARLGHELEACVHWTRPCDSPFALVMAGDALFAGGRGKVAALATDSGREIWQAPVAGRALGLAVAGGRLLVSTDEGAIHCFGAGTGTERPAGSGTKAPFSFQPRPPARGRAGGRDAGRPWLCGPFVEFSAAGTVRVSWDTETPMACALEFGKESEKPAPLRQIEAREKELKTRHAITVPGLDGESCYQLRIRGTTAAGEARTSRTYRFESRFDYGVVSGIPDLPSPYPADEWTRLYERTAKRIAASSGVNRGYCLVLDAGEGRLAYHLARATDLAIIALQDDPAKARRARALLDEAGLYGVRVSVHCAASTELPYGPYFANLIVSDGMLRTGEFAASATELHRLLRPCGGVACLGKWAAAPGAPLEREAVEEWRHGAETAGGRSRFEEEDGLFWWHRRGALAGARDWTHQYGGPDNSACSKDLLLYGKMDVLWWGRPGPRPMPDRGPRNPPPVAANGRLYAQGDRILFGMDAYNGAILWCKQIPEMRRANMPRDCSNMVATDDHLYVAVGPCCMGFEGQTGRRDLNFKVVEPAAAGKDRDWGYLACVGPTLIGSSTRRGAQYLGDQGEWYEEYKSGEIARVTSDGLFALDRRRGSRRWAYRGGVIINSTITVGDGAIYLIESRSPEAMASKSGRLFDEIQADQRLVALSLETGKPLWEREYDFSKCQFMLFLSYGRGTLLATGTDRSRRYHTYAFDAGDGERLWDHHAQALKTHHSGHLNHPVIVGDRVHLNKHTYDLRSGKVLEVETFDYHGCGTMAASAKAIFHRFEYHGMWDLESDTRTEFPGIRGGCWIGQIPSGGVLLAPESGAGCACTHAIQTSIAYVPAAPSPP